MLQQNYGLRENAAGTHQQLLRREEEVGQLSEEVRERSRAPCAGGSGLTCRLCAQVRSLTKQLREREKCAAAACAFLFCFPSLTLGSGRSEASERDTRLKALAEVRRARPPRCWPGASLMPPPSLAGHRGARD